MFAGTHICLPLIISGVSDWARVRRGKTPRFSKNDLYIVGAAGILPDLLSLHISLEARHHSLIHSIWFPLVLLPFVGITFFPGFRSFFRVAVMSWIAVALHLFCDMISGGIPLWGVGNGITGRYYVHPVYWVPLDCLTILTAWFVFFRIRFLLSGGTLQSPTCSWEEKILTYWRKKN